MDASFVVSSQLNSDICALGASVVLVAPMLVTSTVARILGMASTFFMYEVSKVNEGKNQELTQEMIDDIKSYTIDGSGFFFEHIHVLNQLLELAIAHHLKDEKYGVFMLLELSSTLKSKSRQIDILLAYYQMQDVPDGELIEAINTLSNGIDGYVEHLRSLPYSVYLESKHWKNIRRLALSKCGNRCALCGSDKKLNVHHRCYENRGQEQNHLEDVIVLCKKCHAKFHDKLPE